MTKHIFVKEHTDIEYSDKLKLNRKTGEYYHPILKKTTHLEFLNQTNGQLMGSVVSFIFLCIINAAMCRFSMEIAEEKKYSLSENNRFPLCPLRINGDDCIFAGPKGRIRQLWENMTAMVGLESSLGKTYFSRDLCTVNSRIFRRKNGVFESSPFINYGLLYGIKKSATEDECLPVPIYKLGAYLRDLRDTCPRALWKGVKQQFIYYNYNRLKELKSIPWYAPEWAGGLGFPNDGELSLYDRIQIQYIKEHYKELKPIRPSDSANWMFHRLVQKEFPLLEETIHKKLIYKGEVFIGKEQYDSTYSALIVNCLLKYHLDELYDDFVEEGKQSKMAMRHNERMYHKVNKRVQKEQWYISPIPLEEIEHEKKDFYLPLINLKTPLTTMVKL